MMHVIDLQHKTYECGGWVHVEGCCVQRSLTARPETQSDKSEPVVKEQAAVL
jgi:hypothetical protein